MSWDRDSLWAKARIYFERAFTSDREDDAFGLWCVMGLEILARSSIAKFSPTLLAEPDREHKHLLIALGLGSTQVAKRSIATNQVLSLCKLLIPDFTDGQHKVASALAGRRNEELHSGTAAFMEYSAQQWIAGFYKCCKILAESQGESLTSLFGDDEAKTAEKIISQLDVEVKSKVLSSIAAYKKVFEAKDNDSQVELRDEAVKQGDILSHRKHHRVNCPACSCIATVQGDPYGRESIEHTDDDIIVRQSVIPTKFSCSACGLKLSDYAELLSANVANHFTHRSHYAPAEYYDLIDPNDRAAMDAVYADEYGEYSFSND